MFVKTNTEFLSLFCNPPPGSSFLTAELLQNYCRTIAELLQKKLKQETLSRREITSAQKSPDSELNLKINSVKLNRFLSSVGRATDS